MTGEIILPMPAQRGAKSLEESISQRRSVREFAPDPLTLPQLSQVLWAAQGITDASWKLRSVPSAGATYPLDLFVATGEGTVAGLEPGVYQYLPDKHSLVKRLAKDVRQALAQAALHQGFIGYSPAVAIICALEQRTTRRYLGRGERYIHFEVGHASQNIYLQAAALGLGTVAIGAFEDDKVSEVLALDSRHRPMYIMPLGKPR